MKKFLQEFQTFISRGNVLDLAVAVIIGAVLQTIAANLGSMLTPIGNPQNLYLYGLAGTGIGEFIMWLPKCQ